MKKKLIGLFGIVVSGIALASCSSQDQKLSTSKDFELTIPEVDSNAKLLTGEEKTEFIESVSSYDYEADSKGLEEYINGYSSIVGVSKSYRIYEDYTKTTYCKTIIDYKNQNYWYYEKYIIKKNALTYTNEVETKIVLKDDSFIVKTSISLDGYKYYELDDYGLVPTNFKVSGKADIYTSVSSSYGKSIASSFLTYMNGEFYSNKEGYPSLGSGIHYSDNELYVSDNYAYCKNMMNGNTYNKYITVADKEFLGSYYLDMRTEDFTEYYLIKNELLDNSINLDNSKEYTFEEPSGLYTKYFPFHFLNVDASYNPTLFGTYRIIYQIPEDVLKSNFTITEV